MSPEQTISPLEAEDEQRLQEQRAVVHRYVADESRGSLEQVAGKLGLIRALLDAAVFSPEQTWELQCLGIVLGDALVQHIARARWVMVEDEYGRDPAVRVEGTTVLLFPLTMVSKRIEAGEPVDVFDLFNAILDDIDRLRSGLAD
jgi:hypothetical protein